MSTTVKPRIIVTICNGVVDVYSDNVDLSHVDLDMADVAERAAATLESGR